MAIDDKGATADTKELSIEDMVDELGKDEEPPSSDKDGDDAKLDLKLDDEDETEEEEKEPKKKVAKQDDEEEEDKLDLKQDEDEEEFVTPPRRAEILKSYPDLFKKYPYIEKALYRDQQITEMFGSFDDAKEVKEAVETYKKFEGDVLSGDLGTLLSSVKGADEDAFGNIIDNFLPTLNKVDTNAYNHILTNIIKGTLISAVQSAATLNEADAEHLKMAASIIHQYVFGPGKFVPPQRFGKGQPQPNAEKTELAEQRSQFIQERFDAATDTLSTKVDNTIRNTISSNIDPRSTMTPYAKKAAVRDAQNKLDRLIAGDQRFQQIKDKLWEAAYNQSFSRQSLDKIRSAYLSKAKTLLPAIIKKVRAEALNSHSSDNSGDRNDERRVVNRDNKLSERTSPAQSAKGEKGKVPKGMTTLDFLNS